ncbi:MAG: DUF971 domain-containing protein [Pirellula sp.]|jgi:DUF971 family protein
MNSEIVPTAIQRTDHGGIRIVWSDSSETQWTPVELRNVCPCATCKEKLKAKEDRKSGGLLQVIPLQEAKPLKIDSMQPVGNYAYNVRFSDGHSSGIFSFALLKKSQTSAEDLQSPKG